MLTALAAGFARFFGGEFMGSAFGMSCLTALAAGFARFLGGEFVGGAFGVGRLTSFAASSSCFFRSELMRRAFGVSRMTALAGNFPLFLLVHRCEATITGAFRRGVFLLTHLFLLENDINPGCSFREQGPGLCSSWEPISVGFVFLAAVRPSGRVRAWRLRRCSACEGVNHSLHAASCIHPSPDSTRRMKATEIGSVEKSLQDMTAGSGILCDTIRQSH